MPKPPTPQSRRRGRVVWVFALTILVPSLLLAAFAARSPDTQRFAVEARIKTRCETAARAASELPAGLVQEAIALLEKPCQPAELSRHVRELERALPFQAQVFFLDSSAARLFPKDGGEVLAAAAETVALQGWGSSRGVFWQEAEVTAPSVCYAHARDAKRGVIAACAFDLDDLVMTHIADGLEQATSRDGDLAIELVDQRGNRLWFGDPRDPAALVLERPLLPDSNAWQIRVYHAFHGAFEALARREAMMRWATIAALTAAILVGAILSARAVHRELALAQMKSDFVSRVSHELRSPLSSIHMLAEMLEMGAVESEAKAKGYLRTILAETQRLSRLIDNVLDFSRIREGRKQYRFQLLDPGEAVAAAVRAFEPSAEQEGGSITLEVAPDLPTASLDPDAIGQVMTNLLSNALKYSDDEKAIEVRVASMGSELTIEVTDHGVGIAAEHAGKVFDEFYRVDAGDVAERPGAGMGLALCKRLVAAHNGSIEVDSAPGLGSTFRVRIPLDPPLTEQPPDGTDPHR